MATMQLTMVHKLVCIYLQYSLLLKHLDVMMILSNVFLVSKCLLSSSYLVMHW